MDVVSGGDGNDTIIVGYDKASDTVSCGAGWDVVIAGPTDVVAADCERVIHVTS